MKSAELTALGNDTVVRADSTNDEPVEFGRVLDVADRYATLLVTDIDGNPESDPVSVKDAHGLSFGWESNTPYSVRRWWERPLVDDFGNIVTKPTERTVSVYVGRIQRTAEEIKAEQAERERRAEERQAEDRKRRERADLVLKPLRDLLPDSIAHSSYLRAYDAESAFALYDAIVKEATVEEIQPNVYAITVEDPSRFGAGEIIERTVLHLVDSDTYAVVGERATFDPLDSSLGFGFHSEDAFAMAALLVHNAETDVG